MRIDPADIRKKGKVPTNGSLFFTIFQTFMSGPNGTPYFGEANTVFVCRKLYAQPYDPSCFIDKACDERWYPEKDYHTMYIAEIEKVLVKA